MRHILQQKLTKSPVKSNDRLYRLSCSRCAQMLTYAFGNKRQAEAVSGRTVNLAVGALRGRLASLTFS